MIRRILKITLTVAAVLAGTAVAVYVFMPEQAPKTPVFGVAFSKIQSESLGLDWKATYLGLLDDLKARNFRLPVYWTEIEPEKGKFVWDNMDWQIKEAEKRGAKVILVIGRKQFRWPECYIPGWADAKNIGVEKQREYVLNLLKETVKHYKNESAVWAWQVENEPLFPFGKCPERNAGFLDEEIALVRSLDKRPVIITDSGEMSFWINSSRRADIFGTTMYRVVRSALSSGFFYYDFVPASFYRKKAAFIKWLFPHLKEIIVIELQAEPWVMKLPISDNPLAVQFETMNFERFKNHIEYSRQVGYPQVYLWGAEWWYWLKEKQNHPEFWEEAKKIF